jgi:outer membrane autotransporter protein
MLMDSNTATAGSGGAFYAGGSIAINATSSGTLAITNNTASSSGGAFYAGSGIGISGSYGSINFANNLSTASTASKGGGGAIYGNTVQINGNAGSLLFQSNTTINRGGAIYGVTGVAISGSYGKIVIDANEADINGGAIYSDGGGLIISTTTADVLQITNNISKSTTGGGAININGDTQILGSYGSMLLSSNTSVNYNAGLFGVNGSGNNSVIINTLTSGTMEISKNYAKNEGGIASVKNFTISGSYGDILIASNTGATGNGGGFNTAGDLIVSATSNSLTIKNNYSGKSGGAAYSTGSIAISGSYGGINISNNKAAGNGGAFYAANGITISATAGGLAITNNSAANGGAMNAGGGISFSGSYGNMLVTSNTSTGGSGGAFNSGSDITISATVGGTLSVSNNTAAGSSPAYGGGAFNSGGNVAVSGNYGSILIDSNSVSSANGGNGGAINAVGGVTFNTITSGTLDISGNSSQLSGGAIYSGSDVAISGSYGALQVTHNQSVNGQAGAFYANNNLAISGSYGSLLIDSNTSNSLGGAFTVAGLTSIDATVSGTLSLTNNTAKNGNGGAIYSGTSIVVSGSYGGLVISSNTATVNGGAFYSGSSLSLNMANIGNLTVSNNTATNGQGGAFYAGNGFYLGTVTGTAQFTNNKASSDANGGFLWINGGTAEFNVAGNGLILLGDANSIANAADSIGGGASSNVLQSNNGTIVYYANNSNYQGDFNLKAGIAQVSSTLNLLGGKLNGSGTLALDNANAKNGGNDFQFSATQAAGNFNGTIQLQNSSTYTISNVAVGSPTEQILQNSTLRLSGTGVSAVASEINGGMGVLVVDQDNRSIGNLDLAGGKLVVFGKDPVTATSDILNVKQLKSTGAGSVVAVSAATLAGLDTTTTPQQWVGPIFDLSGTLARQIVNATVGVDANVADQGQFALVDITTGSNLTDITNYDFANAGGSVDVGTIHIGYIAQVRTSGSMGLWVTTGVTQIDSTNASELVNISSTQALTAGDQTLAAKLSGTGAGFAFNGGNTITLANLTGDSDYSGTTAISGSTSVKAGADNSLGNTGFLSIAGDGSQFDLNGKNQTIGGGIANGENALTGGGALTVVGGTFEVINSNTNFTANVNIGNSGTAGTVDLESIAAIGNSGTVNFNNAAAQLIVNASGTLSKQLNGQGNTVVTANQDVTLAGNNSGFSGTFSVLDSGTLHASSAGNLGTAAVSGSNGTLQLHGFNDTLANDLQNDLTLQLSDNSAVTINRANTLFSGSAIVDTDNQLTLQNEKALNDRPITDNGLVTLDYTGDWNSVISGSGNVQTLQDLTVTTAQTYIGTTIIDAGTLQAGLENAVSTAVMGIASGATFDLNSFNQTVQGLTNNGTVNFGDNTVGNFRTLTVNGNLDGSGKFNMNVAVGTDVTPVHSGDLNGAGDLVIVTGTAGGSQQILINRAGGNGNVDSLQVLLVQSATSSGTFNGNTDVHQYSGSVDIGMRTANVQQGDLNGVNQNNWYLILSATNPGGGGNTPGGGGHVVLASAAARETAWFDQDTLVKRMGELRLNDGIFSDLKDHDWEAWVRSYGSQYNMGSKVTGFGNYEQMVYGVDIGADKAWNIDQRNVLYTGLFGGYQRSDLDFKYNGSNGGMNGYNLGAYATWLHDTGWYADWVGRAMYMDNSFKSVDDSFNSMRGSYDGWAAGTSIEFGRQFQFKDGWYAEPQFQASYVHFFGSNYATTGDNAFGININDQDSLQLRFGSLFGRTIKLSQNDKDHGFIQPYVKVFGVEQVSDGGEVITGDGRWRANTDGPSAIIGAGLIYQIDETNQLHLDYEAQFADKYDKPFGINFGYRHQF